MSKRVVVVVDTETTGLDMVTDRPYEVAWANVVVDDQYAVVDVGPVMAADLPVTEKALGSIESLPADMAEYARATIESAKSTPRPDALATAMCRAVVTAIATQAVEAAEELELENTTPVWAGINPLFDISMLRLAGSQDAGFHYTPWDVANSLRAAMGVTPWDIKTDQLAAECGILVPGRHTAAGDVRMTIEMIRFLNSKAAGSA